MIRNILFLALAVFSAANSSGAAGLTLVANGKSDYKIVLARSASPSEHRAAVELKDYLYQISGARLSIVPEKMGRSILVGADFLPVDADSKSLGDEGFVIRTVGDDLVIAGGRARGTMYGVYSFLEDTLGVRWYSQRVTKISSMKTIKLSALNIKDAPAFEYREPNYAEAMDKEWAARNRINANAARLDRSTGGKYSYGRFCHTFGELIPANQYFATHPEYFSFFGGKRQSDWSQICMTNPGAIKAATQTVRRWIAENPDAKLFSIAQNDWGGYCECDKCKAVYEEEGSQSGALIRFVNAIAEEIEKTNPNVLIDTIAYQWTEKPPKYAKPRENVRVRLCPIYACQSHPYEQCPNNKGVVDNLRAWSQLTNCLYIWHYNTDFPNYLLPFPDFDELKADTMMYRRFGVKGMFWEGAYNTYGSEFADLRSWVLAKLAWNPDLDLNMLVDDFMSGYYGPSAPYIRQYFDMLHKEVKEKNIHMGIWISPNDPLFSPEIISKSVDLFDKAEKAAAKDPELLRRVRQARLGIDYVQLTQPLIRGQVKGNEKKLLAQLDQLVGRCREYGMSNMSEGESVDAFYNRIRSDITK